MIYFIIGASGSGKSACQGELKRLLPDYTVYEFDEIGVPSQADMAWRQEATETWIKKLTATKNEKVCLLGQMVPGEILAAPSAKYLEKIVILLLDCADSVRIQRLKKRGDNCANQHTLNWAAWIRMHCQDPQWEQHVIKNNSSSIMHFDKWDHLTCWNPHIHFETIDITLLSIAETAKKIAKFILPTAFHLYIKNLSTQDIEPLSSAFIAENFHKPASLFKHYLVEQQQRKREIFVAINDHKMVGYFTILWSAIYPYFFKNNIPEISDLNILPSQQKKALDHAC